MIRTVQQWLTSPEHDALAKGGTLAAFIEAVQRDAIVSALRIIDGDGGPMVRDDLVAIYNAVGALIPPKPKETP